MTVEVPLLGNFNKLTELSFRFKAAMSSERPDPEIKDLIAIPPVHERAFPNFDLQILSEQIKMVVHNRSLLYGLNGSLEEGRYWRTLPWTNEEIMPHRLLASLMVFNDYHNRRIYREYFPPEETLTLAERVIFRSENQLKRPLTVPEQLNESFAVIRRPYPTAAVLLLHSMGRVFARNLDKSVDPRLNIGRNEMERVSRSVAPFDPSIEDDHLGGNYHLYGTIAAGMVFKAMRNDHLVGTELCKQSSLHAAEVSVFFRKLFRKSVDHPHIAIDPMGFSLGYHMAEGFLGR